MALMIHDSTQMGNVKIAAGVIVILFTLLSITLLVLLSYPTIETWFHSLMSEFIQNPMQPINSLPTTITQTLARLKIQLQAERMPILFVREGEVRDHDEAYGTIDLEKGTPNENRTNDEDEDYGYGHDRLTMID